jgi:hypothetical protein
MGTIDACLKSAKPDATESQETDPQQEGKKAEVA